MIEMVKVLSVAAVGGNRLRIQFSNGAVGERDLAGLLAEGGEMVTPLRDPVVFAGVFLQLGTITWPNGFDLDSIALHSEMRAAGELERPAA